MSAALWGRGETGLGSVAVETVGTRLAVGLTRGSVEREGGGWVAAVADGFTSLAPLRDLAAAQGVIDHAGAHGAGDNVGVALAAPEEC